MNALAYLNHARSSWRESYPVGTLHGLVHMGLIERNENLDEEHCYVPCLKSWVGVDVRSMFQKYPEGTVVTCLTCAAFRVANGKITTWG